MLPWRKIYIWEETYNSLPRFVISLESLQKSGSSFFPYEEAVWTQKNLYNRTGLVGGDRGNISPKCIPYYVAGCTVWKVRRQGWSDLSSLLRGWKMSAMWFPSHVHPTVHCANGYQRPRVSSFLSYRLIFWLSEGVSHRNLLGTTTCFRSCKLRTTVWH